MSKTLKRLKQFITYVSLILGSVGVWILSASLGFLDGLEGETIRWRYLMRGPLPSTAPIIYVDLDAEATSYIGDRPWDRRNFGVVINALMGPGSAQAVGVDLIFSKIGAGTLLNLERARDGDLFLGRAVERYKDNVVLAAAYTGTYSSIMEETCDLLLIRDGFDDPTVMPFPEAPSFPIINWGVGRLGLANVDEVLNKGAIPYCLPAFIEVAGPRYSLHLMDGHFRHLMDFLNEPEIVREGDYFKLIDQDGWAPVQLEVYSEQRLLTLGLAVFLAAHGLDESAVEREADALVIKRNGAVFRRIPLIEGQSVEANWFEPWLHPEGAPHYSMREVLRQSEALAHASREGDLDRVRELESWFERFKGAVVFVGPVDSTLKDLAPTPFDRAPVPKVALHANLYRTIQDAAYIVRLGTVGMVVCVLGFTFVVTMLVVWSGAGRMLPRIASLLVFFGYIGFAFHAFGEYHYILPLVAPVGSAITATAVVLFLKLGREEWQRRRIKNLFRTYLSPELVEEMVESQRDPELGGTEAEVTALFSDVEGFSGLSEQLPPARLVALMNDYLSAMTDIVHQGRGTLDKYIGDAIVTMFGMPVPIQDHAACACVVALKMQARHAELRREWAAAGGWPEAVANMRTRIGVNTGRAVIGNMGSRMRFNYTMMGDSVNLAARCESGAKWYGVYTMVTGATLEAALPLLPDLHYRKLDRIVVKGRSEPVDIYELWDSSIDRAEAEICALRYASGLEHYFAGHWSAALDCFLAAEKMEPSRKFAPTTPSRVLAKRCRTFLNGGSPENWDGVYRMKTK